MIDHEDRRRSLDALAVLAGFHREIRQLPDGSIPDVLRIDVPRRGLFVGDAKHTESPCNADTRVRLRRYAGWVRAHRDAGASNGRATFALCVPRGRATPHWGHLLSVLCDDVGLPPATCHRRDLTRHESVLWVAWPADGA